GARPGDEVRDRRRERPRGGRGGSDPRLGDGAGGRVPGEIPVTRGRRQREALALESEDAAAAIPLVAALLVAEEGAAPLFQAAVEAGGGLGGVQGIEPGIGPPPGDDVRGETVHGPG